MLVAIDGNEANIDKRVGVNQFAFQIIWHLFHLKEQNHPQTKDIEFVIFLSDQPKKDFPPQKDWWQYEVFGPKKFWTWTGLVKRLYFGKPQPDILFSPSHYGPLFSPVPNITSIMDLGFLRWPEQFTKKDFNQLKHWTRISAKKADKILAISEFTKKDIIDTYNISSRKIKVIYPGFENTATKTKSIKKIKEKYKIKNDYLLYLGTLKPSKNIDGLIKAFNSLIENNKLENTQLVIAGKKGWLYDQIFDLTKQLNLKDKIIFTGFVEESEIEPLMANAQCFTLPSFWEGFGIPALEAMAANTPVVCSNRGALPEVVGQAAVLVDPDDPKEIAQGIDKLLSNKKLQQDLIELGQKQVDKYSWEKTAKQTLELIINTLK
jgi:glycosyltransferase involved in cell wall biosynthesis